MSRKTGSSNGALQQYLISHSSKLHPVQEALRQKTQELPNAMMMGSQDELQLLANIVRYMGARKTLDIGVFTGYSALTIALALPADGRVVACDINDKFVSVGKPFWKQAGIDGKIDLRLAPAVDTLNNLISNGEAGTFDYAFIDADKENYDSYYELALKLLRPGGLIAVDNTLWGLSVLDPKPEDKATQAIHNLNVKIGNDPRVDSILLDIGDGTMLAWKKY